MTLNAVREHEHTRSTAKARSILVCWVHTSAMITIFSWIVFSTANYLVVSHGTRSLNSSVAPSDAPQGTYRSVPSVLVRKS